ncbi:hypothetical protein TELCIR_00095 [Teladorsagia circumcincta]|uniref:Uncharacterized protein n=1 Tax=Teladorsagia circumcincta TaxID=45464 RepID=A0A2G9V5J7_TELCI|nr:hypothetical protein TELCIR_00095 [Teladorsagia circumcincta]
MTSYYKYKSANPYVHGFYALNGTAIVELNGSRSRKCGASSSHSLAEIGSGQSERRNDNAICSLFLSFDITMKGRYDNEFFDNDDAQLTIAIDD